jgi:hypothetical protein
VLHHDSAYFPPQVVAAKWPAAMCGGTLAEIVVVVAGPQTQTCHPTLSYARKKIRAHEAGDERVRLLEEAAERDGLEGWGKEGKRVVE